MDADVMERMFTPGPPLVPPSPPDDQDLPGEGSGNDHHGPLNAPSSSNPSEPPDGQDRPMDVPPQQGCALSSFPSRPNVRFSVAPRHLDRVVGLNATKIQYHQPNILVISGLDASTNGDKALCDGGANNGLAGSKIETSK